MDENIYIHGICDGVSHNYDIKNQKRILLKILKSDAILSMKMQNKLFHRGFNGLDYISLCDYSKRNDNDYTAFNNFVKYSIGFCFSKDDLEVIKPILVDRCDENIFGFFKMEYYGRNKSKRYSDLIDEVQVKNSIPLNKLKFITIPSDVILSNGFYLNKKGKIKRLKKEVEDINQMLTDYNYQKEMYDIDSGLILNEENIEKLVLKK